MEFRENTLSIDFHTHRATIGYWAERPGATVLISSLLLTPGASELEAAVQDRIRREARAILARLLAELETPGG